MFADIPVESLIHEHQTAYYVALRESTRQTDSAPFVEFMLGIIHVAVTELLTPQVAPQDTPQVARLLEVMSGELSRDELQNLLGLRDRKSFRERYLAPALAAGLIEMTFPGSPNSRLQRYRLTEKGRSSLQQSKQKTLDVSGLPVSE